MRSSRRRCLLSFKALEKLIFNELFNRVAHSAGPGTWGHLAAYGAMLGHPRAILGELGAILGPTWANLGAILGQSWGHLGPILGFFRV